MSRVVGAGCTHWLMARIHGHGPTPVALHYATHEPLEVRLQVETDNVWRFARQLLHDGVADATPGDADVQVYPEWLGSDTAGPSLVGIRLRSDEGAAHLSLERHPVVTFLEDTYRLVSLHTETRRVQRIIDTELADLLRGGRKT